MYASVIAALTNSVLNYILIFGKLSLPAMGAEGAAIATVISQWMNFLLMLILYETQKGELPLTGGNILQRTGFHWRQYTSILVPMLVCELFWIIGENVYAAIYGHLGTDACAAMTLTNPVQGLMIGALCGLSQAAAVIIGKLLGNDQQEEAYWAAKRLL